MLAFLMMWHFTSNTYIWSMNEAKLSMYDPYTMNRLPAIGRKFEMDRLNTDYIMASMIFIIASQSYWYVICLDSYVGIYYLVNNRHRT